MTDPFEQCHGILIIFGISGTLLWTRDARPGNDGCLRRTNLSANPLCLTSFKVSDDKVFLCKNYNNKNNY